jgi:ribosomal protein S18 acetylase RimI-like enzyme
MFYALRRKAGIMDVRPFRPADLGRLLELTIATFGPFHEQSFPGIVGDTVAANQHGNWREDYRNQWQGLHDPDNGKYVVVAEDHDEIVGFIAWTMRPQKRSGEIGPMAVESAHRRHHVASALCAHAFDDMRRHGIEVVSLGTGGDDFHAPARALYDSLGMTPLPVVVYYKVL